MVVASLTRNNIFVVIAFLISMLVFGGCFILKNQPQILEKGFGIYLLENGELVISDDDIVSYNKYSHEIELTEEGVEKIEALNVPLSGRPFIVKINGEQIYNGSFWSPISSKPHSGIIIETLFQNNTIKIEKGYPTSEFFEGLDLRNHPKVFNYLEKVEKLKTVNSES